MSYDIMLFRIETKVREQESGDEEFFDHEDNLEPFTKTQAKELKERLVSYGYKFEQDNKYGAEFKNSEYGISVLLTKCGVYFTTSWDQEAIFEAGMTASEFTDTDEFAKYDPQNGGWEEF
ncbi:hypothetical protein [Elizabethkingia meningoseptica]|uniref:hypothetical protein n=1 Tax=Elizabethkingia meningoseptica TaxID=238 RepID=UPI0023B1BB78|nr:hypothetical protein [Elizabethkingia meningoseptica]MDE5430024.1 hypothetical protein [Elizabethkingia meningoseptica]